ncbi:hypothetical protein [Streptomyces sp. NBC_01187]|nr:hypothetical protein OG220_21325 [Streptomyces sp. NBC_01187]
MGQLVWTGPPLVVGAVGRPVRLSVSELREGRPGRTAHGSLREQLLGLA